ncbi:MAG: hypothetical protein K5643_08150 [Saccharofermentans sp.]|nr:hypothetical protein [Saccharofermentans sp.]
MEVINGQWYMDGVDWDDESCLKSAQDLLALIDECGFMPLFANDIAGFSVENRTDPAYWWTGDPELDPWEWRMILARTGKVAYGKFFSNKAGFISKKWFPYFANYRRNGYDFDSLYEEGKAGYREKLLMDLFMPEGMDPAATDKKTLERYGCSEALFTYEMKEKAGFGKGKEKNFEGVLTRLQMQTYLVASDFAPRLNKKGESYGWAVALMTMPEYLWGYKTVTGRYREDPAKSLEKIVKQIKTFFDADEETVRKII